MENFAAESDPLLAVKDLALGIQLDGEHDERKNRQRHQQEQAGGQDGDDAANQHESGTETEAFGENQPAGIEIVHFNAAGDFFQPVGGFLDFDAVET